VLVPGLPFKELFHRAIPDLMLPTLMYIEASAGIDAVTQIEYKAAKDRDSTGEFEDCSVRLLSGVQVS
jgi:hypothetical protein